MGNPRIASLRLQQQRIAQPDLTSPAAVTRWLGAVQAQDWYGSLYAIGLRMGAASEAVVEQAIADKTIVRTWPMRGTIHFAPPEDIRWMLALLARRVVGKVASIYRRAGLTDAEFAAAGEVFTTALQGGHARTRAELYAALEASGVQTSGEQRGLHLLGYWSAMGLLCLGPRRGKQPTYVLLDEFLPPAPMLEGDEAVATLARRYFTSHGPATEYDFAWWTGLTLTECRRGMRLIAAEFARETHDGKVYWLSPEAAALPDGPSKDAYLLPPYDEFTVAYADRSAAVDPAFPMANAMTVLGPVVVVDGCLVGSWKRTLAKDAVTVRLTLYTLLDTRQWAALEQAVERYGRFIGVPARIERG